MSLITPEQINSLLPQTQCTKCGFNGCKPYAEAIANHEAQINRCSPGGEETIQALATLLHQDPLPIAIDVLPTMPSSQAVIDEERCIGCALCLKACPVDAIIGARKLMHTVITDWCTGCELCIAPCPVDCISASLLNPNVLKILLWINKPCSKQLWSGLKVRKREEG
jgi:electron transport complex protein RnfB